MSTSSKLATGVLVVLVVPWKVSRFFSQGSHYEVPQMEWNMETKSCFLEAAQQEQVVTRASFPQRSWLDSLPHLFAASREHCQPSAFPGWVAASLQPPSLLSDGVPPSFLHGTFLGHHSDCNKSSFNYGVTSY